MEKGHRLFQVLAIAVASALSLSAVSCNIGTISNPVPVEAGDPFLLCDGNCYYLYGTTGVCGFKVFKSEDLRDWTDCGLALDGRQELSWADNCYWAPEVYARNGKYYMFYSADWLDNPSGEEENFRIGVAVSDSPEGPFINMKNGPIFDPGYPIIDADVFFDDETGRSYLYFSRCCYKHPVESELSAWARENGMYDEIEESWVYGVELSPDFSSVIGEPVLLLNPPYAKDDPQTEWESRSVTCGEVNRRWTEGSFTFKEGGRYYMMYSANFFGGANYAVGYAVSDNPLGPYMKNPSNPVLQKNGEVTGTGHCMAVRLPSGRMACVYHGRTEKTGDARVVFIDRMEIKNGALVVKGPTLGKKFSLR